MSVSENDNTQSINLNDPRFLEMLHQLEDTDGTATLTTFSEVLLLIQGMIIRLHIRDRQSYYIGRFKSAKDDEIDLNPYGGLQAGVSRVHAQLIMENEKLYIMDLHSSNGTYLGKKRLQPDEPSLLRNGDEILFGRLHTQVMFR